MARFIRGRTPDSRRHTYRIDYEEIEVTSNLPSWDPNWRFIDVAGHWHDGNWKLLIWAQDDPEDEPFWLDVDGDEHNADGHLECKLCGEWIFPRLLPPSMFREFIRGMARYYIDDVQVTQEEFRAATGSI
jgi:hypothetical protein